MTLHWLLLHFREAVPDPAIRENVADVLRALLGFLYLGFVGTCGVLIVRSLPHRPVQVREAILLGATIVALWATVLIGEWLGNYPDCWIADGLTHQACMKIHGGLQ